MNTNFINILKVIFQSLSSIKRKVGVGQSERKWYDFSECWV